MADGKIVNLHKFNADPSARAARGRPKFIWDFLKGAFGPSIMPTDADGWVERNGHHLLMECKTERWPLTDGQRYMLEDLNENYKFTVFIVRGFTEKEISEVECWYSNGVKKKHENVDAQFLKDRCAAWYEWADKQRRRKKREPEQSIAEWLAEYDAAGEL